MDSTKKIPASTLARCKESIVGVIEKYLPLQKAGTEFEACCPFHDERSPSFKVNPAKRFYYCFGCGASGDAIDFVVNYERVSFAEAVRKITGEIPTGQSNYAPPPAIVEQADPWKPIRPIPDSIQQQPMSILNRKIDGQWVKLKPSARWDYLDANGELLGYIYRFEKPTGGKEVVPQTWCVNTETGEAQWRWMSFDKPRPMYGLDKIAANPGAQIMLVEGEKAADAGQKIALAAGIPLAKLVVVSWPGGGKAIDHVDWSPLHGRNVGLWPDADDKNFPDTHPLAGQKVPFLEQPGTAAMLAIYDRISQHASSVKFIVPPAGVPDGWDVADPFPEGLTFLSHAKAAGMPASEVRARFTEAAPAPAEQPVHTPEPEPVQPQAEAPKPDSSAALPPDDGFDELTKNKFFSILGYDHGHYYLFMHEKLQVISLTKGDLSDIGLIEIAPANFWEEHFPGKNGIDRKAAADWLFRSANARGIYDPARVRGRGAWVDKLDDKNRYVFHHGSHLTVDGERVGIAHIKSAYVYPRGRTMPEPDFDNPLTDSQGMWLLGVLKKARWCMPGSAALLAGWTMLAPVCGALKWRSHIWMAGPAGSGKSTLQEMFCGSLLAGICIPAQGNSTEAGIRQRLKADAIPVLLDEAESNNEREKQRVENILSLIRQSSTESRAETLKGTVSGESMHFHVRSMFCLASINTLLDKQADIDRLTRLSLMKPTKSSDVSQWESLSEDLHKITTDDTLPPKLLARALRLLPVIHQNIAVFTKAAAQFFGTQRMGDQFGTLLAGAWSLISTEPATPASALRMIESFNWTEHTEDSSQDDSMRALEAVLGAKIRMPMSIGEITVFELIRETSMSLRQGLCDEIMALNTLRRHGIVIEQFDGKSVVLFGTTVSNLIHLVEKTPFASDLKGQLLRVAGSCRFDKPVSFNGSKSRCVAIPISAILDESPPPVDDYPL